ncbi:MAG: SDR family NAD(P)-dependent oxidoreductase [Pseudomonadota bacterium]
MKKTILLTGATDGIGEETAHALAALGHKLMLHGRNGSKLAALEQTLSATVDAGQLSTYQADLSDLTQVESMATKIASDVNAIDVLINNAGVLKTSHPIQSDGLDVRFVVNTLAPYLLSKRLLPLLPAHGRIISLSSAAQQRVSLDALAGKERLSDGDAYAQSKLAITMWSVHLAASLKTTGPAVIAVNPASLLGSKMVKDAYGVAGGDLKVGADILVRAALSDEFANATGRYFDNDRGQFASPHADALDPDKNQRVVDAIEAQLSALSG